MSELKRCPFCGGELGFRTWIAFDGESYSLKCSTKDCLFNISSFKNKKDLIKKANTRKPMQNIVERLKALRTCSDFGTCNHCQNRWCPMELLEADDAIEIVKEEGEI